MNPIEVILKVKNKQPIGNHKLKKYSYNIDRFDVLYPASTSTILILKFALICLPLPEI